MVDFTGFVDSRNATELGGARRRLVHTCSRKRMPACNKQACTHAHRIARTRTHKNTHTLDGVRRAAGFHWAVTIALTQLVRLAPPTRGKIGAGLLRCVDMPVDACVCVCVCVSTSRSIHYMHMYVCVCVCLCVCVCVCLCVSVCVLSIECYRVASTSTIIGRNCSLLGSPRPHPRRDLARLPVVVCVLVCVVSGVRGRGGAVLDAVRRRGEDCAGGALRRSRRRRGRVGRRARDVHAQHRAEVCAALP
jgi:hypothetical protein